ncbi:MAG: cupin domain-containing protein [Bacteroidetes bacterium]|nr:cupin domain-containing protein [Bacteroidota bacterium]
MGEIESIIEKLQLKPHPEGGYYSETYRSAGEISAADLGSDFSGKRSFSTAIYFLLTPKMFSAFHRIRSDEMWHFYKGAPIALHMIDAEGRYSEKTIGNDILNGEHPQFMVPAGVWFASHTKGEENYSLAGCTVSPGFDFQDFELANRNELIKKYPMYKNIIKQLTRV